MDASPFAHLHQTLALASVQHVRRWSFTLKRPTVTDLRRQSATCSFKRQRQTTGGDTIIIHTEPRENVSVTQVELVLGGPADAVVLQQLLQQLPLIQELQTLNSIGNESSGRSSLQERDISAEAEEPLGEICIQMINIYSFILQKQCRPISVSKLWMSQRGLFYFHLPPLWFSNRSDGG